MKSSVLLVALAVTLGRPESTAAQISPYAATAAPRMHLQVDIRGQVKPSEVTLQSESQLDPVVLELDGQSRHYSATVDLSSLLPPGSKVLSTPVQLVLDWPDKAESIYLGIGPASPARIKISIIDPTNPSEFNVAALNAIDGLGRDFESVLRKYLMARRFHKFWRHAKSSPNHEIAIRSARIWFDAHTALAIHKSTVFGPDPELQDFIDQYRRISAADSALQQRFSRYFPRAIVSAASEQLQALPFGAVKDVGTLVRAGNYAEAKQLNDAALSTLSAGDAEFREVVQEKQGVTTDMLIRNEKYIDSLIEQSNAKDADVQNF